MTRRTKRCRRHHPRPWRTARAVRRRRRPRPPSAPPIAQSATSHAAARHPAFCATRRPVRRMLSRSLALCVALSLSARCRLARCSPSGARKIETRLRSAPRRVPARGRVPTALASRGRGDMQRLARSDDVLRIRWRLHQLRVLCGRRRMARTVHALSTPCVHASHGRRVHGVWYRWAGSTAS
jgi:hypothetical protein